MAENSIFIPKRYVALGKRLASDGGFDFHMQTIDGDTLGPAVIFKFTPKTMRHILTGHVYLIETSDDGVFRIAGGKYEGPWADRLKRQEWAAAEHAAETMVAAAKSATKLQAEDRGLGHMRMNDLRVLYQRAHTRRERMALEMVVLTALRGGL